MNKKKGKIKEFIYKNISQHPGNIVALVAENFGISRQGAYLYVAEEVKKGNIIKVGHTRSVRYFLIGGDKIEFSLKIKSGLEEDKVWSKYVKPMILKYDNNVQKIVNYGFTEMYNNAIDHSGGTVIHSKIQIVNNKIIIIIMDNGVGIFKKIQEALCLDSVRESILHLSKGKFTTDPTKHTGEGIFFTSRVFDHFSILSSDMYYGFENEDWCLSNEKKESFGQGTLIQMIVSVYSKKSPKEIMDKYADQEIGFGKTIVAVALSSDPNDPHVSRSQAKRLMMGLDKFKTVILDFKNVISVGQAFVDEIFRVFKNEHPDINIQYVNANDEVKNMIKRGLSVIKL
ncbi:MAG TPA: STAS-like domain-containing protein [bacterium]|nr:STAS-like domain-containing protein [bacterium]HPV65679.1 STAS-like domain-containing protein [bacterium]